LTSRARTRARASLFPKGRTLFSAVRRAFARRDPSRAAVERLAAARLVSMAGTDASGVAIGFALYAQTGSAEWVSLSLLLTIGAGALLGPLGGWAGDRVDRRRLMIGAELAAFAVFGALVFVHSPVALLGLGLVAAAIGTVFGPASGAAIAHIAGERHLAWANGVVATGANLGKTAGRLAGGVLTGVFGPAGVFLLDALSFLLSASLIASVRRAFAEPLTQPTPDAAAPEPVGDGGLRFLLAHPLLRPVLASACLSTFATAFSMTAEIPLVFELGAGAAGLGALTACWGAGMVAGSWFAGRVLHRGNEATGVLSGRLAMAAGVGLVAAAPSLGPMLGCYLLGGAGGGLMGVAAQSMILRHVPDGLRGRTLGALESCRNLAFGLGVVGAGALVSAVGARPVYACVGLAMAAATLPVAALVVNLGGLRRLTASTAGRA
jgi:MFS family permease